MSNVLAVEQVISSIFSCPNDADWSFYPGATADGGANAFLVCPGHIRSLFLDSNDIAGTPGQFRVRIYDTRSSSHVPIRRFSSGASLATGIDGLSVQCTDNPPGDVTQVLKYDGLLYVENSATTGTQQHIKLEHLNLVCSIGMHLHITSDSVPAAGAFRLGVLWSPIIGFNAITRKRLRDRQQVVSDTGTTTGATGTVLTDGGKAWTVNEWTGKYLRYVTGPAAGQIKQISSNTNTTITTSAFSPAPTGGGGDKYAIINNDGTTVNGLTHPMPF